MHPDNPVPVGFLGFREGFVQQDSGIVDEDIGTAKVLDGIVEHRLAAGHGGDVGAIADRTATLGLDRVHHLLRHRLVGAGAIARAAEIVDHDGRALARKQLGVGLTEPAARAGDNGDLAVE